MIEIQGLKKVWDDGNVTLKDINITIPDGEVFALVGRSGAGKSTLLRCINGLTSYQEGSLEVDGREVKGIHGRSLREFRQSMGMIFQQFSLLERATVYENVALPMKCWRYSKEEQRKRVTELLELVGLSGKMGAKPRSLSGGQKQRVAIARALTMDAKYLLCDEATSALDPKTTNSILDLLQEINRATGITVIIVTHQMEVVRRACKSACILEHGVITAKGAVEDIFFNRPDSLLRLLGEERQKLPATGRNIRIAQHISSVEDGGFLNRMALDLGCAFPLLDGQILDYRGTDVGMYLINVEESHYAQTRAYLDADPAITWQEIDSDAHGPAHDAQEDEE